jgi:hypothetical protein
LTAATSALWTDLHSAITANRITFYTATSYSASFTAATTPFFGD